MEKTARVQVLLPANEAKLFDAYCHEMGFKKSTLIARLVREHLSREGFAEQNAFDLDKPSSAKA